MLAQNCKSFLGSVSPLPSCWASHWLCVAGVRPAPAAILIPWTLQQSHHTQTMIETTRDNYNQFKSANFTWFKLRTLHVPLRADNTFVSHDHCSKQRVRFQRKRARTPTRHDTHTHTLLISADTLKHAQLQRACSKCTQTKKRETSLQLFEIRFQAVFSVSSGL